MTANENPTPKQRELIEALRRKQVELKLGESAFARLLGIEYSYWYRISHYERPPVGKVLTGIMARLPELGLLVIDYMRESGRQVPEEVGQ